MISNNSYDLLLRSREFYTQKEISKILNVDVRTIRRWESREPAPPEYISDTIRQRLLPLMDIQPSKEGEFKFIDLFAGIGGIRLGFESLSGQCVFTSEWNKFAQKTYFENYPQTTDHIFAGDITLVHEKDIPDFDVLLAGFPCQPFSIAGVSKKNSLGIKHGFEDKTQGTLFFDVARIIREKEPQAFLLENVKNLLSHDKGKTFQIIKETLEDELNYKIDYKVIDGQHFVPQHRERIIIVGFKDKSTEFNFDQIKLPEKGKIKMSSIMHPQNGTEEPEFPYTLGDKAIINEKYTLTPRLWEYLQEYKAKHKAAGNGFGFGMVDENSVSRTLSARYHKDGSEILVSQGDFKRPRRLTPRECARIMGFPDTFKISVSDTQAYRQFGNSVVVPVMHEIAKHMVKFLQLKDIDSTQEKKTISA